LVNLQSITNGYCFRKWHAVLLKEHCYHYPYTLQLCKGAEIRPRQEHRLKGQNTGALQNPTSLLKAFWMLWIGRDLEPVLVKTLLYIISQQNHQPNIYSK